MPRPLTGERHRCHGAVVESRSAEPRGASPAELLAHSSRRPRQRPRVSRRRPASVGRVASQLWDKQRSPAHRTRRTNRLRPFDRCTWKSRSDKPRKDTRALAPKSRPLSVAPKLVGPKQTGRSCCLADRRQRSRPGGPTSAASVDASAPNSSAALGCDQPVADAPRFGRRCAPTGRFGAFTRRRSNLAWSVEQKVCRPRDTT